MGAAAAVRFDRLESLSFSISMIRSLQSQPSRSARCEATAPPCTRRNLLFATPLLVLPLASAQPASARIELINKEVDSETSPYIQSLKAKSDSLRDERKRERLKAYERKVFKEYLEFEAGTRATGKARGISEETNSKILDWLKDEKE